MSFLERFTELFETYSYGNVYYGKLCAHVLMGQAVKNNRVYFGPIWVDPRVSLFLMQPSGTGKSTPVDYIFKVGQQASMRVSDIDDASDVGLIGGIEDEEVIDPETHTKIIEHNKVYGKLSNFDILHYDEGKMLIDRPSYAANALTWIQKALNPIGSQQNVCTRTLKHGEIFITPSCSFIITTHPLSNLMTTVLDAGFFQRVVLYCRDIPLRERQNLGWLRADKLGNRTYDKPDIENLGQTLQKIRAKYSEKQFMEQGVVYEENTKPVIKGNIKKFYDLIAPSHEKVKEIMATFIPRYENFMYIFGFHHCCDRMGDKVTIPDINYGYGLSYVLFQELMSWVEEAADFYKLGSKDIFYLRWAHRLYSTISKDTPDEYVFKGRLMKLCKEQWVVSLRTVNKYFEKFSGYGALQEYERTVEGVKVKYIKLKRM